GNVRNVDVAFTRDTVAPVISITSPTGAVASSQNITITGSVNDATSSVVSFQAALGDGTFADTQLDNGKFSLTTAASADGTYVEHFQATDSAGNVRNVDFTFTLDTVAPTLSVSSPAASALLANG